MFSADRNFTAIAYILALSSAVMAQEPQRPDTNSTDHGRSLPTASLLDLVQAVEKKSGKDFLIAGPVPERVVAWPMNIRDVDYETLLTVLANNGFAVVQAGKFANIVPLNSVRMYTMPLLLQDDESVAGLEWVTRIVQLENSSAQELVPIVRPLLIQAGHLAAIKESNSILIVERYGNAKRIAEILEQLDKLASDSQ